MRSNPTGKIKEAKRYAEEKDRITSTDLTMSSLGEHSNYTLSYKEGKWNCSCPFFYRRGICSHSMTLQRILASMLSKEALSLHSA